MPTCLHTCAPSPEGGRDTQDVCHPTPQPSREAEQRHRWWGGHEKPPRGLPRKDEASQWERGLNEAAPLPDRAKRPRVTARGMP